MLENPFPPEIRHLAITAPAGLPDPLKIKESAEMLKSLGIKVSVMPNVCAGAEDKYISASIEKRLSDLHKCLEDESVDLILCARGGYGSAQLLPGINWKLFQSRKIPLLGYSDITVLHLAMLKKKAGIPVASPMADKFCVVIKDDYTVSAIRRSLSCVPHGTELLMPSGIKMKTVKKPGSEFEAPVVLSNLTMIASLCGSEYFPDLRGKLLILEDINEDVRKLDRALTQLRLAGVLEACAGLVFGHFSKCGNNAARKLLINRFSEYVNGPVFSGFSFGHLLPMAAMRFNTVLRISAKGRIYYA